VTFIIATFPHINKENCIRHSGWQLGWSFSLLTDLSGLVYLTGTEKGHTRLQHLEFISIPVPVELKTRIHGRKQLHCFHFRHFNGQDGVSFLKILLIYSVSPHYFLYTFIKLHIFELLFVTFYLLSDFYLSIVSLLSLMYIYLVYSMLSFSIPSLFLML
jgi:hypothetical protein